MPNKKEIGKFGEQLACEYLQKQGYEVLDNNWQKRKGEIDLICVKDKDLVFVEVKTRTKSAFGHGEQAVDCRKKQKISAMIDDYLFSHPQFDDYFPRFDIVVVEIFNLVPKYYHLENVELY